MLTNADMSDADKDAFCQLRAPPMQEENSGTDVSEFDVETLRPMTNEESLDTAVKCLL